MKTKIEFLIKHTFVVDNEYLKNKYDKEIWDSVQIEGWVKDNTQQVFKLSDSNTTEQKVVVNPISS